MPIRRVVHSIEELLRRTAAEKRDAAVARARGRDSTAEPSSDVYEASCAEIASHFSSLGFRYAKSGPHFSKRSGDFTFKVSFQSSYHNIPGRHVALRVAANVASRSLKAWRAQHPHPFRNGDFVAGGLLGNLLDDHPYIEWDLGGRRKRTRVVADIVEGIQTIALPYFERFSDPVALASWLRSHELPAIWVGDSVEFVGFYSDLDSASEVAGGFLRRRPELVPEFNAARRQFSERGFPAHLPTKHAEQLAWVVVAYGLNPQVEGAA